MLSLPKISRKFPSYFDIINTYSLPMGSLDILGKFTCKGFYPQESQMYQESKMYQESLKYEASDRLEASDTPDIHLR